MQGRAADDSAVPFDNRVIADFTFESFAGPGDQHALLLQRHDQVEYARDIPHAGRTHRLKRRLTNQRANPVPGKEFE